jgi:arylsulfatase B
VLRHYGGAIGVLADYWDNCYLNDTYYDNGEPTKVKGYCTDVFFSAARQFIDEAVAQDRPFFVYLPTNAPHGPRICPPPYAEPYRTRRTRSLATFYGMIANIDENVGKLRAHLERKNLHRNTIFIFCTDNGTAGGQRLYNAGMRGNKGSSYDGGHRVPFFLHWPAGGFDQERRIETLTAHIDVFPTLLDLCGLERPQGVKLDGRSLRPLLEKGDHPEWPDRIIMTDSQKKELPTKWATTAVMSERWRLIEGTELYDIDADPGQKNNVFDEHPQVVERLTRFYDALWDDLEPAFQIVPRIPLTAPGEETVPLNYHDCIGRHFGWFQNEMRQIRNRIDPPGSKRAGAFWPVEAVIGGEYRIELRRWPVELDHPITADLPPGDLVYNEKSHRSTPGTGFPAVRAVLTIDDRQLTATVNEQTKAAVLRAELVAGSHRISAKFFDAEGRSLDVFYVYVSKMD